jgi:hypothetical protein
MGRLADDSRIKACRPAEFTGTGECALRLGVLRGAMVVLVGRLGGSIVLSKGFIVAMVVTAAIGADFRLKYGLYRLNS